MPETISKQFYEIPGIHLLAQTIGPNPTAYILSFVAYTIYTLGFVYCNENNFSVSQTSLIRAYIILILSVALCLKNSDSLDFKQPLNFRRVTIRNLIMLVYSAIFTWVQFYLPLPIVHSLNNAGAIFALVMNWILYGVQVRGMQVAGTVLGFLGILVMIRGGVGFQYQSKFENYQQVGLLPLIGIYILLILTLIFWAYAVVTTKTLSSSISQINYNLAITLILASSLHYPLLTPNPHSYSQIMYAILYTGIPMGIGQFCFVAAIKLTKETGTVTIIGFTGIIIGYFVSVGRYEEEINLICLTGTILIVVGVLAVAMSKGKG